MGSRCAELLNSFAAIILFDKAPRLDTAELASRLTALEPGVSASVADADRCGKLRVECGAASGVITVVSGQIPEQEAIASIGMVDLPEADVQRLLGHGGYVQLIADDAGSLMDRMILLIKSGMALCTMGGWALCLPSSGLCMQAEELARIVSLNASGPRVWGLDEAEAALPGYEPRELWESLRQEAQPANLLVGFVPAQVENETWFFSAGHSLFGLSELAYSDGTLEDYETIRELFRYLFPFFFRQPEQLKPGTLVKVGGNELVISLHALPKRFAELQATTGTLRLRLITASESDDEWQ